MTLGYHPVFVVMTAAVVGPLLAQTRIGARMPVVVLEVLLGIIIGPQVLGWIQVDAFLSQMIMLGMAAALFMAGMEVDFSLIRGRPLALGLWGWVASVVIGLAVVMGLHVIPGVRAPMMVTLALTTTMLGALLPGLRDGGTLDTPFGRLLVAAGTVGEVGPIVAVALLLSQRFSTWLEFGYLVVFLALVAVAASAGVSIRHPRVLTLLGRTLYASTQLPVRLTLLVLAAFFVLSDELGLEGILGAFAAGMVVGLVTRDAAAAEHFRLKIDAVCFGFLTPFFFVGTGIRFDLAALARDAKTMLLVPAFLLLFLVVRGLPVLIYRHDLPKPERLPFALSASVASLGLVVVITQIGMHERSMSADIAQALIAAALLSMLVYPTLAGLLASAAPPASSADAR